MRPKEGANSKAFTPKKCTVINGRYGKTREYIFDPPLKLDAGLYFIDALTGSILPIKETKMPKERTSKKSAASALTQREK